jgi:hypothetical protein
MGSIKLSVGATLDGLRAAFFDCRVDRLQIAVASVCRVLPPRRQSFPISAMAACASCLGSAPFLALAAGSFFCSDETREVAINHVARSGSAWGAA